MRVDFVGSGDAFGSGGRWQTCIHLSGEGQVMLVDCGATSLVALKAQGLDPGAVDAVAVTHLHGDHFGGLPFLILDGQFSRRSAPLQVAGPPGIRTRLAEVMEALFPGSSQAQRRFPAEVTELDPTGMPRGRTTATVSRMGSRARLRRATAGAASGTGPGTSSLIPGTRSGLRRWPKQRTGRTCSRWRPTLSTGRSGTTWIIRRCAPIYERSLAPADRAHPHVQGPCSTGSLTPTCPPPMTG